MSSHEPVLKLPFTAWFTLVGTLFVGAAGYYELRFTSNENSRAISSNAAAIRELTDAMRQLVAHDERLKQTEKQIDEIKSALQLKAGEFTGCGIAVMNLEARVRQLELRTAERSPE